MRVTVKLYGNLRKYSRNNLESSSIDVPQDATVRSLLGALGIPFQDWWMIAVNDLVVGEDALLHDNDHVEVFEPVAGG